MTESSRTVIRQFRRRDARHLLLAAVGFTAGCAGARPTGFFPVTYWCPPPAEDARYKEAADCGFNLAFNGDVQLAKKYGMKCLVAEPRVAAAVANPGPQTDPGLDLAARDYADRPAFWGFYLTDEPGTAKFAGLAHVNQHLLNSDPNGVPFINLYPDYANQQQLGAKTYAEYVDRFMTEVRPKVLSYDYYSLMKGGPQRPSYFHNMEIIRSAGLKYGVPYWFIFLITPHYNYRDPTEGDLRWQVYTALTYGYKGLVYFTYWSVNAEGYGESIIGRDGKRTGRYWLAQRLNGEINSIGPVLARLTSLDVYHTAPTPPVGTHSPGSTSLVRKVEGGDLVVGELADPNGRQYLFLTNASPEEAITTRVTLAEGVAIKGELQRKPVKPKAVSVQGQPPQLILTLAAGDGRLFEVNVPASLRPKALARSK